MTIDFSQDTGSLFYQGPQSNAAAYYLKLKGRYSNDYLDFDTSVDELTLTIQSSSLNWHSYEWTNDYNKTKDIAGYYIAELYGDDVLENSQLCKVINVSGSDADIAFTSSANENNEQIIFYR